MRVLNVIRSLHPSQGGPSTVMPQIAKALVQQGLEVDVVCVDPVPQVNEEGAWIEQSPDGYRILTFPPQIQRLRFSLAMIRWLHRNAGHYDLIHVHGVLSVPCLAAEWEAVRNEVALVVRPYGILNRWGMESRKAIVKRLWFHLLEKPLLDRAAAMHYTSQEEDEDVARLGIKAPAHVIPLGLDMSPFERLPDRSIFRDRFQIRERDKAVLFLSRIHPKKGLEVLFEAFAALHQQLPNTRLIIAGDGEKPYVAGLHCLAADLGIASFIIWTGFLNPQERLQALSASDLFCLPSNSENFGIALLEAMAAGLPCISSPEVALAQEKPTQGALRIVPRDAAVWAEEMAVLLRDPGQASALGAQAIRACRENYSISQMGNNLTLFYGGICESKPKTTAFTTGRRTEFPSQSLENSFLSQITPVVLTWNEEANLKRCLERLHWAHRVVVIDSHSNDATTSIAANFPNVEVFTRAFDTHTNQWNHGIDQSKTEWVLALDADYVLGEGFADELASLAPPANVDAYEARFRYCVYGKPLRASLYPPRAVLFRHQKCRYFQDGHTQLLGVGTPVIQLHTSIDHDDRKPLTRWISSQDKYAQLEAQKLLAQETAHLSWPDRLRCTGWAAVPASFIFVLIVKRTLLDGWEGWFYALQRTLAEVLLALRLLEKRLTAPPQHSEHQSRR